MEMPLFKIETWAAELDNEPPISCSAMSKSPLKKNKMSVHLMELNRRKKSSLFNTKV